MGRILRRYQGMTLEAWRNLSEDDKFEYLAHDHDYQDNLERLATPYWDKIRDDEPVNSVEAFFNIILAGL